MSEHIQDEVWHRHPWRVVHRRYPTLGTEYWVLQHKNVQKAFASLDEAIAYATPHRAATTMRSWLDQKTL